MRAYGRIWIRTPWVARQVLQVDVYDRQKKRSKKYLKFRQFILRLLMSAQQDIFQSARDFRKKMTKVKALDCWHFANHLKMDSFRFWNVWRKLWRKPEAMDWRCYTQSTMQNQRRGTATTSRVMYCTLIIGQSACQHHKAASERNVHNNVPEAAML